MAASETSGAVYPTEDRPAMLMGIEVAEDVKRVPSNDELLAMLKERMK